MLDLRNFVLQTLCREKLDSEVVVDLNQPKKGAVNMQLALHNQVSTYENHLLVRRIYLTRYIYPRMTHDKYMVVELCKAELHNLF